MDLPALTEKAMDLRRRFGEVALERGGREWSREELAQGFVVDVGDLMRVLMAKSGIRDVDGADAKLGHELADCLWSVLVLARLYEVDLEKEFLVMIEGATRKLETGKSS